MLNTRYIENHPYSNQTLREEEWEALIKASPNSLEVITENNLWEVMRCKESVHLQCALREFLALKVNDVKNKNEFTWDELYEYIDVERSLFNRIMRKYPSQPPTSFKRAIISYIKLINKLEIDTHELCLYLNSKDVREFCFHKKVCSLTNSDNASNAFYYPPLINDAREMDIDIDTDRQNDRNKKMLSFGWLRRFLKRKKSE